DLHDLQDVGVADRFFLAELLHHSADRERTVIPQNAENAEFGLRGAGAFRCHGLIMTNSFGMSRGRQRDFAGGLAPDLDAVRAGAFGAGPNFTASGSPATPVLGS